MKRRISWPFAVMMAVFVVLGRDAAAQATLPDDTDMPSSVQDLKNMADKGKGQPDLRRSTVNDVVQAGPIDANLYLLGPGDLLQLDLWGRISRTMTLEVNPEGRVFLVGRGSYDVGGKSLAWVRERVLKAVAEQYVGVHGEVRLIRLRTFKVYLSGEVKQPGALEANGATRASEPVSEAIPLDQASRRNIQVRHADGTTSWVDLDALEILGRQERNPMLVDGDVINVPKRTEFTEIAGAVPRPLRFELAKGDSLSTLIALAGGALPAASPERALLVRFTSPTDRESVLVDLSDATTLAMPLRDGDRLFVNYRPEYHRLMTVQVTGEVEQPGSYPIVPGRDRMSDLLKWAGGFRSQANREAVHLVRETDVGNERNPEFDRLVHLSRNEMTESEYAKLETELAERKNSFRVDWTRLQPGSATDPLLQDADVVRVDRFVPTVRIEGQVRRPGFVDYAPGRSLEDYVELAGGFTERSARTSIRVSRSLTGQIIPARSLNNIQPGDFIWVPERRDVDAWAAFRDIVAVASQVAVVIFTLSRR